MKRREYKRYLVRNCGESAEGLVNPAQEARCRKELERQLEVSCWAERPRCVNDFMLGGDPEFAFSYLREARVAAHLWPGLAFGADQNGRLGELRLAPSHSVLDLVAGARKSLKWLRVSQAAGGMDFEIVTLPIVYFRGADRWDGIGGHIHFGRKSSEERRKRELDALDGLYRALVRGKVWLQDECDARTARARYGRFGDSRLQKHGFEYRSFPSWLGNPWKMFLVITLAKLTVYNPELPEWDRGEDLVQKIRLFLGYYQGMDDDARLAKKLLGIYGLPIEDHGETFKAWGLDQKLMMKDLLEVGRIRVWPTMFEVSRLDKLEAFEMLLNQRRFRFEVPEVDWEPIEVSEAYQMAYESSSVYRVSGIGDLCCDTVVWKKKPLGIYASHDNGIWVSTGLVGELAKGWREEFSKIGFEGYSYPEGSWKIQVGENIRNSPYRLQKLKELLTGGMFPIWKVKEVKKDSWKKWESKGEIKGISLRED